MVLFGFQGIGAGGLSMMWDTSRIDVAWGTFRRVHRQTHLIWTERLSRQQQEAGLQVEDGHCWTDADYDTV